MAATLVGSFHRSRTSDGLPRRATLAAALLVTAAPKSINSVPRSTAEPDVLAVVELPHVIMTSPTLPAVASEARVGVAETETEQLIVASEPHCALASPANNVRHASTVTTLRKFISISLENL